MRINSSLISVLLTACLLLSTSLAAQEKAQTSIASPQQTHALDKNAVRIINYFMVGQDYAPEANIRLEQFTAQLDQIKSANHTVVALPRAIKAWKTGQSLPQSAFALTFDGGHRSILTEAAPELEKRDMPFTVFIDPARADIGAPQYLGWKDIRRLQRNKDVTIGLHPLNYAHFTDTDAFTRSLNSAQAKMREELSFTPSVFAYPYGKYNEEAMAALKERNIIALGQQSGVANASSNHQALPRFTMTENYADNTRFNMIINSVPLPASDMIPEVSIANNQTAIGFSSDLNLTDLRCYSSNDGIIPVEGLGAHRAEIRVDKAAPFDRHRINCTLQHDEDSVRWLGFLLISNE